MWKIIEKFIAFILLIIFVTFMVNHGHIDFSGVDMVNTKVKDAAASPEGQEIISEVKDIGTDVVLQLTSETKKLLNDYKAAKTRTKVSLVRVVDGDTLVVKLGDEEIKVRMIGIDTPESVNADETKNTIYGTMASEYTKTLLINVDELYLEFDNELEDVYGRVLAYVWLTPEGKANTDTIGSEMINGILVKEGYAIDKVYGENDRYAISFSLLKEDATANSKGLWQYEEYRALSES